MGNILIRNDYDMDKICKLLGKEMGDMSDTWKSFVDLGEICVRNTILQLSSSQLIEACHLLPFCRPMFYHDLPQIFVIKMDSLSELITQLQSIYFITYNSSSSIVAS